MDFAVFCLASGWASFPLFLYQVFFMEKFNLLEKMEVFTTVI